MAISRVLLVDDEQDMRVVGELSLRRLGGWEVSVAPSGEAALGAAARFRPDVILLDVMMPGIDGPETLARLRAAPATGSIPVIFLTARAQPDEVARLTGLGARGVIAKPFDPLTLPSQVRALIEDV